MYNKSSGDATGSCVTPESSPAFSSVDDDTVLVETVPALDWSDITALLKRKLTTIGIEKSFR